MNLKIQKALKKISEAANEIEGEIPTYEPERPYETFEAKEIKLALYYISMAIWLLHTETTIEKIKD